MAASQGSTTEWASWIAALLGLWVLISPFVLGAPASGEPAYWSDIIAGVIVLILSAYTAYDIRGR